MDIIAIEDAIQDLESADTTVDNITELSRLYIVHEHLKNKMPPMVDGLDKELQDIIPSYKKYCNYKEKFQRKEIADELVVDSLSCVLTEISDLLKVVYQNTDLYKERKLMQSFLDKLTESIVINY